MIICKFSYTLFMYHNYLTISLPHIQAWIFYFFGLIQKKKKKKTIIWLFNFLFWASSGAVLGLVYARITLT